MTKPITGGCLCGAIRYESSAEPVMAGHCHCLDCKKRGGASRASVVAVPKAALKVTGAPKRYASKADSGNTVQHAFCSDCGSSVFGGTSGMPDLAVIHAGTLDDQAIFKPGMHVYTDRAQPWDHIDTKLPCFPGMPEMADA